MIPEAFLLCALSLPISSSHWDLSHDVVIAETHLLRSFMESHAENWEFLMVKKETNFTRSAWEESWQITQYVWDGFRIYARKREREAA